MLSILLLEVEDIWRIVGRFRPGCWAIGKEVRGGFGAGTERRRKQEGRMEEAGRFKKRRLKD